MDNQTQTQGTSEVKVETRYSESNAEVSVPLNGDLMAMLELQETREITVHGKPLIVNLAQMQAFLNREDSDIQGEAELAQLLESKLSTEDVEKIYSQQLHKKLVGQQFEVSEVGELTPEESKELVLLVPEIKLSTQIVEQAIESIANDDMSKYVTFLPPQTEEEKIKPVRCVTGNVMRTFLNEMQTEDGELDMNSQIKVYCTLLTNMPDDDPTKKYGLMQLRALMQYGDVVSNRNLRLALTKLIEGETVNG